MKRFHQWTAFRIAASVLIGALVTPISGASPIATNQQELAAVHGVLPASAAAVDPRADGERLRQIALLAPTAANDTGRLFTQFPTTLAPSSRADTPEMGLQLPEPGPLSAIIATLALAAFVMIRRVV